VEGDAHLDRPAGTIDRRRAFPDPVPGPVDAFVVEKRPVHAGAGRIDGEVIAAPAVEIRVDAEVEPVRFDGIVAAAEPGGDAPGRGVVEPCGDIEIVAVKRDPYGCFLGGRPSVERVGLDEIVPAGKGPDGLGQDAVEFDRPGRPDGEDLFARRNLSGEHGRCGGGREGENHDGGKHKDAAGRTELFHGGISILITQGRGGVNLAGRFLFSAADLI